MRVGGGADRVGARLRPVGARGGDLRLGLLHIRDRLQHARLRLLELCLRIVGLHHREQLPGADVAVVGIRDRNELARNLRRDADDMRIDERVVGAYILARVQPPQQAADHDHDEHDPADDPE